MYEAPPGAPEKPPEARFTSEALLSNIARTLCGACFAEGGIGSGCRAHDAPPPLVGIGPSPPLAAGLHGNSKIRFRGYVCAPLCSDMLVCVEYAPQCLYAAFRDPCT
jgi:hypothetical protein